jgi:hypothetical protein
VVACWSDDEASGADATWRPRPSFSGAEKARAERRRRINIFPIASAKLQLA